MIIKPLPPTGKISEPGFYDVPIETYHGDCCDGPSISSSGLRTIESQSPAHYWHTSALNPDREPPASNQAFDFGRAAHNLLLGEGEFAKRFAMRPEAFKDYKTNAAKDWRDAVVAEGKTPVTTDDLASIKGIARSLEKHPLVQAGIMTGPIEVSMFWKDATTGIWLKSRPDAVPQSGEVLADIKTTTDACRDAVARSITQYAYHVQGALAAMGMKALTGRAPADFVLIFVEKTPPWCVSIVQVDPEALLLGARQIRRALDTFARCLETNDWPGPIPSEETIGLQPWALKRLEFDDQHGLLPKVDATLLFNTENA